MLLLILDYLGTFAFAVSGALKGVRKGMDLFGVIVLALVTAIGGGTLRDALLDQRPFWLGDQAYVLISLVAAGAVFVLFRLFARTERALLLFDAVGLGVFTAIGAMKAQAADAGGLGMVTMAVTTGVGGGMMRDVLARDIPVVLREEIYASASIAGALVLWGFLALGLPETVAICAGTVLTVLIRILSILLKWKLPRRDPDSCRER